MKPKLLRHSIMLMAGLILVSCNPVAGGSASTPTATPIPATPTITLTPAPPTILIGSKTDCFGGPGADYRLIASFEAGDEVKVVGKDDYGEYWIVVDPKSGRGCWIRREGTTAQGITDYLPNLLPPPTPLPDPPAAPTNLAARYDCARVTPPSTYQNHPDMMNLTIDVTWEDKADNETSYRVYVNGNLQDSLDANATAYRLAFQVKVDQTGAVLFGVEAYNTISGTSERAEITVSYSCQ
ncbi:MAG: hypothetical protein AB1554_11565 [Chloroflexota bacterium]